MRVRTPTILQMEAVECGAAALGIVLAHFGKWVPLEKLRVECGVSRDGAKASNIVKAARRAGLEARGFQKEPGALRTLSLPQIVFWNFNHFLVVEGFGKEHVWLNDPASGPRKVTHEEFDLSFTGVVLTFSTTPEFTPGGAPPSVLRALRKRLSGHRHNLIFLGLCSVALALPNMATPAFRKVFVDRFLIGGLRDWVSGLLLLMTAVTAVQLLLEWRRNHTLNALERGMMISESSRFVWHILHLPVEFFAQREAGDITARVGTNESVASLISGQLADAGVAMVLAIFYGILLFQFDAVLASIALAGVVFHTLYLRFVSRWRVDAGRRQQQDQGKLASASSSGLMMIESLKARGSDDFFGRWAGYHAKVFNASQRMGVTSAFLNTPPALVGIAVSLALMGMGALRIMDGTLTVGLLLAFETLSGNFTSPVTSVLNLGQQVAELAGNMARIDDVANYPRVAGSDEGRPAVLDGDLAFEGVTFGYSPLEKPLLQELSFHLRPGARMAMVGTSGSGKSTVAKLVSGLYRPWSGEVRLNGIPRGELSRDTVAAQFAMVDQEIYLFPGTVRENLTMWDESIPEEILVRAAKDACIHDAIASRPGGYLSRVTEGGSNFSGGQRQRLEIARALVRNPKLLVLDEATSALDPATEQEVADNLRSRGCTCLIIAHRLSTIRDCDEILVIEQGQIVERGTHSSLIAEGGAYARLVEAT